MSANEHEQHGDELAPYLLGALEPGEAAALERHLAGCEECRTELEWLRPAVQLLPESVERVEPAPRLRQNLMEQVRAQAESAATSSNRERRWGIGGWSLRPLAGPAAVVLVVAAVAAYAIGTDDSGGGGETTTVTSGHAPGVTAQMVSEGQSGTLHLANLHQLPTDKVLQAWVRTRRQGRIGEDALRPQPGRHRLRHDRRHEGASTTVMVTAEPRGGSAQPTSAPIASVSVPQ